MGLRDLIPLKVSGLQFSLLPALLKWYRLGLAINSEKISILYTIRIKICKTAPVKNQDLKSFYMENTKNRAFNFSYSYCINNLIKAV